MPALLLELAATGAQATAPPAAPPLLDLRGFDPCPRGSNAEVVVCGSRDGKSRYRLPRLDNDKYRPRQVHPENVIPGGRIHVDSTARPDGLVDKRIMITFAVPF